MASGLPAIVPSVASASPLNAPEVSSSFGDAEKLSLALAPDTANSTRSNRPRATLLASRSSTISTDWSELMLASAGSKNRCPVDREVGRDEAGRRHQTVETAVRGIILIGGRRIGIDHDVDREGLAVTRTTAGQARATGVTAADERVVGYCSHGDLNQRRVTRRGNHRQAGPCVAACWEQPHRFCSTPYTATAGPAKFGFGTSHVFRCASRLQGGGSSSKGSRMQPVGSRWRSLHRRDLR